MPTVEITSPITIDISVYAGTVGTTGRSAFHQLLYVDDLQNTFFNLDEFAESVSYSHTATGESVTYAALFDDPHVAFSMGEVSVNNLRPQIQLYETAMQQPPRKGDRCRARNINYIVDDFQKDGVGVLTIFLRVK